VQKFSKRGWLCKTWEGELAMVSMPGTNPEKFYFSVRDEAVAEHINQSLGRRVRSRISSTKASNDVLWRDGVFRGRREGAAAMSANSFGSARR